MFLETAIDPYVDISQTQDEYIILFPITELLHQNPLATKPTKFCLLLDVLTVDDPRSIQVSVEHLDEDQVFT
jgi:hypothetical protein